MWRIYGVERKYWRKALSEGSPLNVCVVHVCVCVCVCVCVFIPGVSGWYVLSATLGMPRMWEMERRSAALCGHAPDGRSRFSDWLVPGGRSAVGVLSLLWRKVEGQLPPELHFPLLARRGSSSLDESHEVKTRLFFFRNFSSFTAEIHQICLNFHFSDYMLQSVHTRPESNSHLVLISHCGFSLNNGKHNLNVLSEEVFKHTLFQPKGFSLYLLNCFTDVSLSMREG